MRFFNHTNGTADDNQTDPAAGNSIPVGFQVAIAGAGALVLFNIIMFIKQQYDKHRKRNNPESREYTTLDEDDVSDDGETKQLNL